MPKKMMFARLDVSTFLICCSGDLSDNESDEKPSVAICGGSICILTGLFVKPDVREPCVCGAKKVRCLIFLKYVSGNRLLVKSVKKI